MEGSEQNVDRSGRHRTVCMNSDERKKVVDRRRDCWWLESRNYYSCKAQAIQRNYASPKKD